MSLNCLSAPMSLNCLAEGMKTNKNDCCMSLNFFSPVSLNCFAAVSLNCSTLVTVGAAAEPPLIEIKGPGARMTTGNPKIQGPPPLKIKPKS